MTKGSGRGLVFPQVGAKERKEKEGRKSEAIRRLTPSLRGTAILGYYSPTMNVPPREAPVPPHPALNAMLICDMTIREEVTGKTSLIGIFENIEARQFPVRQGLLCVYAKLP